MKSKMLFAFTSIAFLVGCSGASKLPAPRPSADMCDGDYKSYRYSTAAAQVETIEAITSHNFNESRFYDRCIAHLQGNKPGGSR